MGIQVCSYKVATLVQGKIITKKQKYIAKILKSSSQEPLGQFQPNLAKSILGWWGFKFIKIEGPPFSKGR